MAVKSMDPIVRQDTGVCLEKTRYLNPKIVLYRI